VTAGGTDTAGPLRHAARKPQEGGHVAVVERSDCPHTVRYNSSGVSLTSARTTSPGVRRQHAGKTRYLAGLCAGGFGCVRLVRQPCQAACLRHPDEQHDHCQARRGRTTFRAATTDGVILQLRNGDRQQ